MALVLLCWCARAFVLASPTGFEPVSTVLETVALPVELRTIASRAVAGAGRPVV